MLLGGILEDDELELEFDIVMSEGLLVIHVLELMLDPDKMQLNMDNMSLEVLWNVTGNVLASSKAVIEQEGIEAELREAIPQSDIVEIVEAMDVVLAPSVQKVVRSTDIVSPSSGGVFVSWMCHTQVTAPAPDDGTGVVASSLECLVVGSSVCLTRVPVVVSLANCSDAVVLGISMQIPMQQLGCT